MTEKKKKKIKATEEQLSELHRAMVENLLDKIKSGTASSADLNTARQFLRDNGIACDGEDDEEIHEIVKEIPTFEDNDVYVKPINEK